MYGLKQAAIIAYNQLILHMDMHSYYPVTFTTGLWAAVYRVSLKQPSGSSLVVNHCTANVRVTSDRTFTLGIVPFEVSTSISGSHAATYIVNVYVS